MAKGKLIIEIEYEGELTDKVILTALRCALNVKEREMSCKMMPDRLISVEVVKTEI